jgi:hypothetical protein
MTPTERFDWLAYDGINTPPRADQLDSITTITEGYTCDLKVDTGRLRIWLHRTSIEDGEPYRNTVTIECRDASGPAPAN